MLTKTLHFGVANISRNKACPDNAVAACAYRSGLNLTDAKTGEVHRYAGRGGVIQTAIFAPRAAPGWMQDDDQKRLWERFGNEIERVEDSHNRRASALLAKDFPAAAPRELTAAQNWAVAEQFARRLNARGLAVAVAFHETDASDGGKNPHFHFLVPLRRVDRDGFESKRYRTLDAPGKGKDNPELRTLRREYFALVNDALADAGVTRIYYDPEKQEDRTPQKHKGKVAWALERKEADRRLQAEYRAMDALLLPAVRGIRERGEVPQIGMGKSRWERLAFLSEAAEEYEQSLEETESGGEGLRGGGSWQDYVSERRAVSLDNTFASR